MDPSIIAALSGPIVTGLLAASDSECGSSGSVTTVSKPTNGPALGGGLFGSTAKAGSDLFIGFIFFAWFVAIGVAPALVLNWLAVWADRQGDHSKSVPSTRLQPPT